MTAAELLREIGIPGNYVGYKQLLYAVELVTEDEDRVLNVYRDVYLPVGQRCNTSATNVEKNIRTVLQAAWQRGDFTRIRYGRIAGYNCPKRPAAGEFLDVVSDYLRSAGRKSEADHMAVR